MPHQSRPPSTPAPPPGGFAPQGTPLPQHPAHHPPSRPRIDGPTWAQLLVISAPKALASAFVVWCIGYPIVGAVVGSVLVGAPEGVLARLTGLGVLLAWACVGGFCLYPRTGDALARWLLGLRLATAEEEAKLVVPWYRVMHATGRHPHAFRLWVQESEDINASAAGAGIVAVTRSAVEELSPPQLEAVLAHELGHHTFSHARFLLALNYYGLPVTVIARLFNALTIGIVGAIWSAYRDSGNVLMLIVAGCTLTMCCLVFVLPFLVPAMAALFGAAALSRATELAADRYAAQLGYAPALQQVLQHWIHLGHDAAHAQMNPWQRATASHPTAAKRIQRLQTYLNQPRSQM
ncbi:M48 family metallopeptidase [Streptomonospora halophila]|uniref:M48 family metallopeptidase n=1 Tax=Streptomonospora halophila TaxID=427369 RepID=UPI0031E51022